LAAGTQQYTQAGQQQQQDGRQQGEQQLQVQQLLDAEGVILRYHVQRMQAGDSRLQELLPVLQGMSRRVLGALTGSAGVQQQQQRVHQYLDAHIRAKLCCADSEEAMQALDTMCSIWTRPPDWRPRNM
jgi:hypothetical protein